MANLIPFAQVATIMKDVVEQATGHKVLTPTNLSEYVNVATTALSYGVDPVIKAISTVLARTIYSVRPYSRKFRLMEADASRWGYHIRKINFVTSDVEDNDTYKYPALWDDTKNPASGDGESVDQWVIKKEKAVQTNFYGSNTWGDHISIFEKPFEIVFTSPAEFGMFISTMMTNWMNKREQYIENVGRALMNNAIASLIDENNPYRVVHLITEYNNLTGSALTPNNVYAAENFRDFIAWVYSKVDQIAGFFTENSELYQTKIGTNYITRHTPPSEMQFYRYTQTKSLINAMVMPGLFNPRYLQMIPSENINFFQSILEPAKLSITPTYMDNTGSIKVGNAVETENIFGILCDREFMGYSIVDNYSRSTPVNARAEYYNIWWKVCVKCWMDNSEKAVVFLLD